MEGKVYRPQFQAVVEALLAVFREGYYADKVIERRMRGERQWGVRDRKFFAELTYDCIRWWRKLNWVVGRGEVGSRPGLLPDLNESEAEQIVRAYLCIIVDNELPAWIAVNPDTKALWREKWNSDLSPDAIAHSLPDWLETRGASELGEAWLSTIDALNLQAPVFLRANRLKATREEVAKQLAEEEIMTDPVDGAEDGLILKERRNVFITKAFKAGLFEVQDGGSQQIVPLLAPEPGERVIDACAGAGGKTLHIAARMKNRGKVLALDVHGRKLDELKIRSRRAGADIIEIREITSTKVLKRLAETGDRVLLDVPCSGSGVWRRNPDGRWKLTAEEVGNLHELQAKILSDYSKLVKPGGVLVYSTCSLWPSENQHQVQKFLKSAGGKFSLDQELTTSPNESAFDGFYAARLVRG